MNLNWDSPISKLFAGKKTPKYIEDLSKGGYITLNDLLWVIPLKIQRAPRLKPFREMKVGQIVKGRGKIISLDHHSSSSFKGKRGVSLMNITVILKDISPEKVESDNKHITLKWFNSYPSTLKKLNKLEYLEFSGPLTEYAERIQVINPEIKTINDVEEKSSLPNEFLIQYPTINGVKSDKLKKCIDLIPKTLWENIEKILPDRTCRDHSLLSIQDSFKLCHGKTNLPTEWSNEKFELAMRSLAYYELLDEQLKIQLRKDKNNHIEAPHLRVGAKTLSELMNIFPFDLTNDQKKVFKHIQDDLDRGHPMMRLVQGDVGCGKTSVAILAAALTIKCKFQTAFMSPTESLARQHLRNCREILSPLGIVVEGLFGSTPNKEKKNIYGKLKNGEIDLIVGTHSLFQDNVIFKKLGLAIVDEQHKFGVKQRQRLLEKGVGVHCLIMTATPIPRTLSLTQYGDLEVSIIKESPGGRKGIKTKIVRPFEFEKFLSFLKTRIEMSEQAYLVVPAIEENPEQDMIALETVLVRFKKIFPNFSIDSLHGKMSNDDKNQSLVKFEKGETQVLISTSVVEVGIDVHNATIMAILNPERFGLSSLHQLRGRVGRGGKPGFCFLILDKFKNQEIFNRLTILEKSNDGFKIAEEDLMNRGQGNLFGLEQSGNIEAKKVANILKDTELLYLAAEDAQQLISENDHFIQERMKKLSEDKNIFSTI